MRFLLPFLAFLAVSCYQADRDCKAFRTGKFRFQMTVDGQQQQTVFERTPTLEIEHFQGKTDTSTIRWVSDCEYVLQKLHPHNRNERKGISIKILSTTEDSYTFEFGEVGSAQTIKGTAVRTE